MRMLRWMCGVTKKDNIRNKHVRGCGKVASVAKKTMEERRKQYGLSEEEGRREDDYGLFYTYDSMSRLSIS